MDLLELHKKDQVSTQKTNQVLIKNLETIKNPIEDKEDEPIISRTYPIQSR